MRGNRELRARQRRFTARPHQLVDVQMLEKRTLLAGNAIASLNGPHLTVLGDTAANTVEITVIGGDVVVRGLDDTTVNGSTDPFVVAAGSNTVQGNIYVSMGTGNDTVLFSRNVQVTGSTVARGGQGDDSIGAIGGDFQSGLWVHGDRGDDTVSVQDSTVGGKLWIKTNQGDDTISVTNTDVNGRLKIKTGNGDDAISVNTSTVSNKFSVHAGAGRDDVSLQGSTFESLSKMRTRSNSDAVVIENNTFLGPLKMNLGRNDDSVLVRAGNTFHRRFKAYSGDGNGDAVEINNGSTFRSSQSIRKTESLTVSPSVVTARFDDDTTGVIAKAEAADQFFTDLLVGGGQDLTLDVSGNSGVESVGDVLVTRDSSFDIAGTATPRSVIELDVDGDGQFDDGSTTADDDGNFLVTATLIRQDLFGDTSTGNDELDGFQTITVRATDEAGGVQNATTKVDFVVNTVVQFVSNRGTFEVETFDAVTPNTVANFLGYLARYENMFVHRKTNIGQSAGQTQRNGRIVQGGGFTIEDGVIDRIATDAPIQNEFSDQTSNIRRTLAMAQLGGNIDSGTSQWFFNIDNPDDQTPPSGTTFLDNVPHTVFGRVVGEGMTVLDGIVAIATQDINSASGFGSQGSGPFTDVPIDPRFQPLDQPLTGTVTATTGDDTVIGVGTRFTEELVSIDEAGEFRSRISINGGPPLEVQTIVSDTELTLVTPPSSSVTNGTARTDQFRDEDFVRFSAIQEIL